MAITLTKDNFNQAMCDVRKAHRLIYAYQRKVLDLTYFIKSKLGFPEYSGNRLFCNPIAKKRDSYASLNIFRDMWAWDFLYSYVFEYYFGEKSPKNCKIVMSIIQVSDTGFYDTDDSPTELTTFASEDTSMSKLIFVVEKKDKKKQSDWNKDWIGKEVYYNHKRMSANHTRDCLNHDGNIQIIYSFPFDRFLNEETTIAALEEFVKYSNDNGIQELKLA